MIHNFFSVHSSSSAATVCRAITSMNALAAAVAMVSIIQC